MTTESKEPQWTIVYRQVEVDAYPNRRKDHCFKNRYWGFYGVSKHYYKPNVGTFDVAYSKEKKPYYYDQFYQQRPPFIKFKTEEQAQLRMEHVYNAYLNRIRRDFCVSNLDQHYTPDSVKSGRMHPIPPSGKLDAIKILRGKKFQNKFFLMTRWRVKPHSVKPECMSEEAFVKIEGDIVKYRLDVWQVFNASSSPYKSYEVL